MAPVHLLVTGARSTAHLVHIGSYLDHLLDRGEAVEAVYPAAYQPDLHDPAVRRLLPERAGLSMRTVPPGEPWRLPAAPRLTYLCVGAPGLKAWARLRRAHPRAALDVVVVDEGLGSYGGWRTRHAAWRREGVPEPWCTVRATAVAGGARLLTGRRWAMYERDPDGWRVVPEVADAFRSRAGALGERSGEVVLLTQPWVTMGLLPAGAMAAQADRLAEQVARTGRDLVVRPHPNDDEEYRGHRLLDRPGPAELDPRVVGAAAVLGGPSTALLNLAAVHGVPAVRVGVPQRPDLEAGLGAAQRELLEQYVGPAVGDEAVGARLAAAVGARR